MGHHRVVCRCGEVIAQCRCMAAMKPTVVSHDECTHKGLVEGSKQPDYPKAELIGEEPPMCKECEEGTEHHDQHRAGIEENQRCE